MSSHHHHHNHSHSLGEQNEHHFDNVASYIFKEEWIVKLVEQATNTLRASFPWMGVRTDTDEPLTMLDYACGNGLVSRALSEFIPVVRGMDISSGMVAEYNNEASKAGFTPSQMHAVQGDIVSTSANPETHYDLIIMSLALHHIEDPEGIITKLAQHLKPGTGVLVIADWIHPDESGCGDWRKQAAESDNPARHTVSRAGFKQDEMKMAFTQAGFEGFKWKPFEETSAIPGSANQRAFLARGVRAAERKSLNSQGKRSDVSTPI